MTRVAASCLLLLACARAPGAEVKPAQIVETREQTLIKKEGFLSSERSRLVVKLNVKGPDVRGATKWGQVKLVEAVDDAGTDLKATGDGFRRGEDMDEINRFGQDETEKAEGFDVELELGLPARKATAIKSLKGTFQVLAGGEEKVATFTKLKSMQGKPLADPALKAAGLDAKVGKPTGGDPSLVIDYKGPSAAITKVEILNAAGESVSSGHFSSGSGDEQNVNYMLGKPLDDTMTLKLHLVAGQKTITVPFELKELKLP